MALSASLLRSPSQQWPRASREQHSHPPLLTAALCQATCLARVGRGVARRLDNNFCQWNGVRIRLGTQTREVCPGLVLQLAGVLGYRQASCLAVSPHLSEEAGLPLSSALMGKKVHALVQNNHDLSLIFIGDSHWVYLNKNTWTEAYEWTSCYRVFFLFLSMSRGGTIWRKLKG